MKNFMPIVKPISRMELKAIISRSIKLFGPDCDLNRLDTFDITNMHYMFAYSVFNGNIGSCDVSRVTSISQMFQRSSFNQNISKWDVSNVMTMSFMFENTEFNIMLAIGI